ncbi:uncharacterized protein [Rutidosis leptorrhynchoides]|uniref:uncharacterized protein n=1 Tax=Rutidosis leptorrhynchoides TaxID=125765 RepID=UPI003A9997B4
MCSPDWMTPIRAYIMDGTLPDDQKSMRKAAKYTIIDGSLYKRSMPDNGKQFDCEAYKNFLKLYEIEPRFTSVAHPAANDQVEVKNRSILDGLKKKLKDLPKKEWVNELPKVLWAYRNTAKLTTGETPFKLAYSTDVVIPVDVRLRSFRIQHDDPIPNKEGLLLNLDLIDEV